MLNSQTKIRVTIPARVLLCCRRVLLFILRDYIETVFNLSGFH